METHFSQIEFNIFLTMLKEYIAEKEDDLARLENGLVPLVDRQRGTDIYGQLIDYAKTVVNEVQRFFMETKDFFEDAKMEEAFNFFRKCFSIAEQTIKCLIDQLRERVNRAIDGASKESTVKKQQALQKQLENSNRKEGNSGKKLTNHEQLKRVTRVISKDLQNIDYFLNMLANEDFQTFNDSKLQFQKLMHHRRSIENIHPSQASKQILQTAVLIENAAEAAEKIFHESYLINYLEFKSYLSNIRESQMLVEDFKKGMESSTKEKFLAAIVKNADRIMAGEKDYRRLHQVGVGTQTEDTKFRMQEKLQNLLMVQKRNNERLNSQLLALKKSYSNFGLDKVQFQRRMDKEVAARKELEGKCSILENLYNQKCYQLSNLQTKSHVFKTEVPERTARASVGVQALIEKVKQKGMESEQCQTDVDFYYYFENSYIQELQKKIAGLEKIVNHKDYVIKEMEAVRTFRDNFKSKKQIFSAVFLPKRAVAEAKSLHYLHEQGQSQRGLAKPDDNENILNSIEASSTKKLVTFRQHAFNEGDSVNFSQLKSKKRKNRELSSKNRSYCAFNDKVVNQNFDDEFISEKGECENPHQISLKSILKVGYSNNIRINMGTQTDLMKNDAVVESVDEFLENKKEENKQKSVFKETARHRLRPSVDSTVKSSRGEKPAYLVMMKKSNFNWNQNGLNQHSQRFQSVLPALVRNSENLSPLLLKQVQQRPKNMLRVGRVKGARMNTISHEILHVNNTLNLNFAGAGVSKMQNVPSKENVRVANKKLTEHRNGMKMRK